jgi:hypothetical protein
MTKKILFGLILVGLLFLRVFVLPVSAQESEFSIGLRRDFGYGAGSNIRGTFTISLTGDESQVGSVEFLIDGNVMATDEQAPFRFQFHTDDYGVGMHQLSARVFLKDGRVVNTSATGLNFLSQSEERQNMVTLFVGIGGTLALALVIYFLVERLVFKRKPTRGIQPGQERNYGLIGGTICPKCGRPFPRHIWGINLLVGKLDRCEHCGKWSMTVGATSEQIRAAEAAELEALGTDQETGVFQGQIQDSLEDTKYLDEI